VIDNIIGLAFPFLNQYQPGTFGCSVVHVMARGRAFHNAAASSLEPRSLVVKHPRVQYRIRRLSYLLS
jgi:hypothetical protein